VPQKTKEKISKRKKKRKERLEKLEKKKKKWKKNKNPFFIVLIVLRGQWVFSCDK
jgi:hypothetical protein